MPVHFEHGVSLVLPLLVDVLDLVWVGDAYSQLVIVYHVVIVDLAKDFLSLLLVHVWWSVYFKMICGAIWDMPYFIYFKFCSKTLHI